MLRNALGDTDNEGDLGRNGFLDTSGGQRRPVYSFSDPSSALERRTLLSLLDLRYEDGGGSGARLLDSLAHISEDGEAEMLLAGLLRVCASHDLGTYRKRMSDPIPRRATPRHFDLLDSVAGIIYRRRLLVRHGNYGDASGQHGMLSMCRERAT